VIIYAGAEDAASPKTILDGPRVWKRGTFDSRRNRHTVLEAKNGDRREQQNSKPVERFKAGEPKEEMPGQETGQLYEN